MIELFLLLFFILTIINYLVVKDFKYPPFIYTLLWFTVMLIYYLAKKYQLIDIYNISFAALLVFLFGALFFSIGGFTMYYIGKQPKNKMIFNIKVNQIIDNIFFAIPILFLPLYINKAISLSASTGMDNFFIGLRVAINYGDVGYGYLGNIRLLVMFIFFYKFMLLIILDYNENYFKIKTYIIGIVTLVYIILTTGRIQLLLLVSMILIFLALAGKLTFKKLIISFLMFFSLFILYAIVLNKGGNIEASFADNIVTASETFLYYLVGGLVGFSYHLTDLQGISYGDNTFKYFLDILRTLGISNTPNAEQFQEFIKIPFKTNVFTVYDKYISDFSYYGFSIIFYILGLLHTYFYIRMNTSLFYKFMYSLLTFPILMSIFDDQYFSSLSGWVKYFLLALFTFTFVVKSKKKVVKHEIV